MSGGQSAESAGTGSHPGNALEWTAANAEYRCTACGNTAWRRSEKRWIRSYCSRLERMARLWRTEWPVQRTSPASDGGGDDA